MHEYRDITELPPAHCNHYHHHNHNHSYQKRSVSDVESRMSIVNAMMPALVMTQITDMMKKMSCLREGVRTEQNKHNQNIKTNAAH